MTPHHHQTVLHQQHNNVCSSFQKMTLDNIIALYINLFPSYLHISLSEYNISLPASEASGDWLS